MKYAIISDIHGNYTAFVECLKKIEKLNIDEIIFCGDYITDFPEPHDVLKLIKECEKTLNVILFVEIEKNIYAILIKTKIWKI